MRESDTFLQNGDGVGPCLKFWYGFLFIFYSTYQSLYQVIKEAGYN